jgi:hypothetical protein
VAEFTSEKKALDNLVSYGMLRRDIADIIQRIAEDKLAPVIEPEGPDCRLLMLLIDKSGSMKDLKKAVIDGQHHLINSLLGASSTMTVYLGQKLFNNKIEPFQPLLPLRSKDSKEHKAADGIKELDETNYVVGGQTALHDTILSGIATLSTLSPRQQKSAHKLKHTGYDNNSGGIMNKRNHRCQRP